MAHIYKVSEWQGGSGRWFCNDMSDVCGDAGKWWIPARVLGITPAAYIEWLVNNYKPDNIGFENNLLFFSWNKEHYNLMHSYLLYINKIARQKKFMV